MEEKERYEVMSPSLNGYAYIHDFKTDNVLNTYDSCDLLNQQDKRIKELEKTNKILSNELTKNSILKQDHIETCCGIPIFEIPKMKEENQQLKQQLAEKEQDNERLKEEICKYEITLMDKNSQLKNQLHDLPKKIVEEIEKNFTEYLPLKDKTGAGFYSRLNAILKKYGGEDESNND